MNIGGENRPIKFGINQSIIYCRLRGVTINQMDNDIKNIVKNEVDGSEIRDLLYSALKDGARVEKTDFNFTPEDVGDWMEDISQSELVDFFSELAGSMPKSNKKESKKK